MRVPAVAVKALERVRNANPQVYWTPDFMRLGHLLSVAQWVARDVEHRRMLETSALRGWYPHFPRLRDLAITRSEVPFRSPRLDGTAAPPLAADYAAGEPNSFLRSWILDGLSLETAPRRLVVNVRRGDYYSVPDVRGVFGFDQAAYLRCAVEATFERDVDIAEIHVVSDGIDWCRARLSWLSDYAPVTFTDQDDPFTDFMAIAQAEYVILPNSTFSFWAGHVHDVLWPGRGRDVWIPRFFARWPDGHFVSGLPADWSVIDDIPGGWDS